MILRFDFAQRSSISDVMERAFGILYSNQKRSGIIWVEPQAEW